MILQLYVVEYGAEIFYDLFRLSVQQQQNVINWEMMLIVSRYKGKYHKSFNFFSKKRNGAKLRNNYIYLFG